MTKGRVRAVLSAVLAGLVLAGGIARAQGDPERVRTAKALVFDRKYAEARQAWGALRATGKGPEAATAAFWIARCSENLGEHERALKEFGEFLALRPADRALAEEARTSRVGLAVRLYKAGQTQHLPVVLDALKDPGKTVRYYAALQLSSLGSAVGRPALPVLKAILAGETDEDLVERAKLGILRLDPEAFARADARSGPPTAAARATPRPGETPRPAGRPAYWMRIRVFEKGGDKSKVSINLPMALAELLFKSLPDDVKRDLKREGYDAETFWEKLRALGPTEIIDIEGDEGEKIQIWTE
jgi:hypothetical protein